jgi:hypothetical protein
MDISLKFADEHLSEKVWAEMKFIKLIPVVGVHLDGGQCQGTEVDPEPHLVAKVVNVNSDIPA